MIKNLPPIESISKLGYYKLFELKKSLKRKISTRTKNLQDAENERDKIKIQYGEPKNALEQADISLAENKVVEINAEIFILNNYLNKVNKYLEPMLKELDLVQPGNN